MRRRRADAGGPGGSGARDERDDEPVEGGAATDVDGAAVVIPITGELDLHAYAPRDIPSVVAEYVHACAERGLPLVRLVHGRGRGVQRAEVRRALARLPEVESFHDAAPASGGWGATVIRLRKKSGAP